MEVNVLHSVWQKTLGSEFSEEQSLVKNRTAIVKELKKIEQLQTFDIFKM